ncbi:MAG: cytochrome c1 [Rhodovibrionaceae bacterium]
MKKLAVIAAVLLGLGTYSSAQAAEDAPPPPELNWSFDGIFGTFDRAQLQRGFQVYKEVCAACHAMEYLAFRDLSGLGYTEEQIDAFAADFTVTDGPDETGEMFQRPGAAADRFPAPFANEQAARYANGGAYPPNLSLMAEARAGGADYIHALLIGYKDAPADVELLPGQYYNEYFPGNAISMAPPLIEGGVSYADGTEATVDQMATDVAAFLTWTAEPQLEERKTMGVKVILFLLVFTGLLYAVKRKVWADLH